MFLIVTLLALWSSGTEMQFSSLEDQLANAQAKWAMAKVERYEFTLKRICFCPPAPPGSPQAEPIVFRVENGRGVLMGSWAAVPEARQGFDKYSTIEKQFEFIRAELRKRPYRAEIEYDSVFGYPRRVYIDPEQSVADEEYGFALEGFRPLSR